MNYVVFDIETKNTFADVGSRDPALLDLAVIALYDSEDKEYRSFLEDELDEVWSIMEKTDALVGFNSDHFDVPLLNKYYHGDLAHIKSIDLLKTVFNSLGRRIGLDAIAEATLGKGKTAHGLQAIKWWNNGEIDKVRSYCIDDVKVTHELYNHMRDKKQIKYKDTKRNEVVTVDLDTSEWDDLESGGITQSLPF